MNRSIDFCVGYAYRPPRRAFDVIFARSVFHTLLRRTVRWRGRDVVLRASAEEVV